VRNSRGEILAFSVITTNGKVLFTGNVKDTEDFWDNNVEYNWCYKKHFINGEEVHFTNIGEDLFRLYKLDQIDL
jgi:hypothetical protein